MFSLKCSSSIGSCAWTKREAELWLGRENPVAMIVPPSADIDNSQDKEESNATTVLVENPCALNDEDRGMEKFMHK